MTLTRRLLVQAGATALSSLGTGFASARTAVTAADVQAKAQRTRIRAHVRRMLQKLRAQLDDPQGSTQKRVEPDREQERS
jgi:ornithine cyclodeaminase/alanine dehydrogenase-like protein (mu-crystallin family)